jgi:hypothetical protein
VKGKMQMAEKSFKEYLDYYTNLMESDHPFTYTRWGDGEIAILDGSPIGEQYLVWQNREWKFPQGGESRLGRDLAEVLKVQGPDIHFGLPCRCCSGDYYYNRLIHGITESPIGPVSLFINNNYKYFLQWLTTLNGKGKSVSLLVNHMAGDKLDKFPFKVQHFWPAPDHCVEVYEEKKEELLASVREFANSMTKNLVFVSAGPLSEVFILEMWKANPTNQYVDVGSALDQFTKNGMVTRPYHDPRHPYSQVQCRMY